MSDPLQALRAIGGSVDGAAPQLPNIPSVPNTDDQALLNFLSSVKSWIEKANGSGITGLATKQDLINAGLMKTDESGGFLPVEPVSYAVPPVPTGVLATGALTNIIVEWANPRAAYSNHAYAEVWAAESDNFTVALQVGESTGKFFIHAINEDATRYYWVRFVSRAGVKGPYQSVNGVIGATSKDPSYLMSMLASEYPDAPFINIETPTTIDGVLIPVGTYMKKAYIMAASIGTAQIKDLAVDRAKIAHAAIGEAEIDDAVITNAKIADATIEAAKIKDATITTAKIQDAAIGSAKIQDAAIKTAHIDDLSVNSIKIAGNSVTTSQSGSFNGIGRAGASAAWDSSGIYAYLNKTPQAVVVFFSIKVTSCSGPNNGASPYKNGTVKLGLKKNGALISDYINGYINYSFDSNGNAVPRTSEVSGFFIDTTPGFNPFYQLHTPYGLVGWAGSGSEAGHSVESDYQPYNYSIYYNCKMSVLTTIK